MDDGDTDWIDITAIGDNYRIHYNTRTGRYRHRRLGLSERTSQNLGIELTEDEWIPGHPDDKKEPPDEG